MNMHYHINLNSVLRGSLCGVHNKVTSLLASFTSKLLVILDCSLQNIMFLGIIHYKLTSHLAFFTTKE